MKYRAPIKSPYVRKPVTPISRPSNLGENINEIVRIVQELKTIKGNFELSQRAAFVQLDRKLAEAQAAIERTKIIQKGDKGEPGKNAEIDYNLLKIDYEHIINESVKRIPPAKNGVSPTVDYAKIISEVVAKLPKVKDKKVDVNYDYIIAELKSRVTTPEVDPMKIIDVVMNLPEGKRIPLRLIDGLEQTISAMRNQLSKGYLHGGGLSAVSHDTTLSGDGTPDNPLKVIGGGGSGATLTPEALTGTQDGVNTIFTATHTPVFINNMGQIMTDGNGYTLSGLTVTFDVAPPASPSPLQSFYNSTGSVSTWVFNALPTGTVNGVNLVFTIPSATQVVVYADGVRAVAADYVFSSNTTITFVSGRQPFSSLAVDYLPS